MAITIRTARAVPARADLVAVLVSSDGEVGARADAAAAGAQGFEGEAGTTALTSDEGRLTLLVGLGKTADVDGSVLRAAGAVMARAGQRVEHLAVDLAELPDAVTGPAAVQAFVEGVHLGAYRYVDLKSEAPPVALKRVSVAGAGRGAAQALERADIVAGAVNWARDQVNRPGGSLLPAVFADEAVAMAKRTGLTSRVMTRAAIERAKLGGLLGVNRGSANEPRVVRLNYKPSGTSKGHLAFVGKGITFDSGGLSIKSGAGMMTMKCDMGGAAAVLGAMGAIGQLQPDVEVTAVVPMTDNMTGPDATRPGDVLRARNGKTIEVLNTDAEGRLILADGLCLAAEAKPDAIVDCATLTGACMVALGGDYAGVMGNDDAWVEAVRSAAEGVGELMWPLPLPAHYRQQLDSSVADLKNIGGSHGGALTAGLFLEEFVPEGMPWAHIDLAGPAFNDAEQREHPKGGTGYGVRTLVELAESYRGS